MGNESDELRGGRYVVTRALGAGSQGDTLEAVDKQAGRLVAIKRFQVRGAKRWKDVELAEREARVLASLSHPGLPAHVEHFEEGGALYLVMEKIEGESLGALRGRGVALGRGDIVRLLREASVILEYLHGRAPPVIHRDIKPGNVLRRPDGSFALIDFGAVRDRMRPEGGSTVVGTFGYMAPEQFQGRAQPGSDIYALGATALTMLTGQEPEALPHQGLAIDVAAALRGRADPALVEVLSAMLQPDPDRRPGALGPLLARLDAGPPPEGSRAGAEQRPEGDRREGGGRYGREGRGAGREGREAGREGRGAGREGKGAGREGWAEEWAKQHEEWAERHEEWAERHEERHARKAQKRAKKEQRHRGAPPALKGMPLGFAMMGLLIARVSVALALGVVVPLVLSLLSIVFGRPLRDAARRVREAGREAGESIGRARGALREQASGARGVRVAEGARGERRVRVEVGDADEPAGRARAEEGEDLEEAEAEAAAAAAAERRRARSSKR